MSSYEKPMLRITRETGIENFISIQQENAFMLNILNKVDRKVVKVERGLMIDKDGERTFEEPEVIWQSKSQETKDLAAKAMKLAHTKHQENEELRKQLAELEGTKGVHPSKLAEADQAATAAKAEAEAAKAEAESAKAEAETVKGEAGAIEERLQTAVHTMNAQAQEIEKMRAEIERLSTPAAAATTDAAETEKKATTKKSQ